MKYVGIRKITGKIIVKTGLHIGAGNERVEIGGMDNPIIRNPLTREPYIPGSSLKGKMRSLIEWRENKLADTNGAPCNCGKENCKVCRVFGAANKNEKENKRGPTRLIVRDAVLTNEWSEKFSKEGRPLIEEKNENALNRITASATPRPIERVVSGVEFDFEILYRIIDTDDGGKIDEENFSHVVLASLSMLENDYLGGGGTRGNGRISFSNLQDENGKAITLPNLNVANAKAQGANA